MQQRARRLAMFFGGSFLAGAGLFAAACGTDNGTTPVPTTDGAARDTGGGGRETSTPDDDSSTPTGDAGANCDKAPKPKSSNGPFCFAVEGANPDDGGTKSINCDNSKDEICCSGARIDGGSEFEPSKCEVASPDNNGPGYKTEGVCQGFQTAVTQWHCTESAHCPGQGERCCAIGSDAGVQLFPQDSKEFPGCAFYQSAFFVGGTRCKDECAAGELNLCASDADCKNGTCQPIEIAGRYAGFCRLK